jgi:hypothetical protein
MFFIDILELKIKMCKHIRMNPTYTDTDVTISRNLNIPFNYIWEKTDQNWQPMSSNSLLPQREYVVNKAYEVVDKYGAHDSVPNAASATNPETVWEVAGEYVFPPDIGTGVQVKSDENSDVQEIVVRGLDENFLSKSWTGNLNGTGEVDIGTFSRVFRAWNNDSTDFAGDVNIHASGDDSISYATINSNNQTQMAVYTVPADSTGYLVRYSASASNPSSSTTLKYTIQLKTREFGKVFRVKDSYGVSTQNNFTQQLLSPQTLPPKTDILTNIVSANGNGGSVFSNFTIALLR